MRVREWMNDNSMVVLVVMILLILLAVWIMLDEVGMFGVPYAKAYYYDVKNKTLFSTAFTDPYPPIDAPSGKGNGVLAYVFTCSDCSANQFIGYLEKYTPEAKRVLENENTKNPSDKALWMQSQGKLVRLAAPGSKWVPESSPQANKLMSLEINAHCKANADVHPCYP